MALIISCLLLSSAALTRAVNAGWRRWLSAVPVGLITSNNRAWLWLVL